MDPANPFFSSLDGVLFDKNQTLLIRYPPGIPASNYSIPVGVTTTRPLAFHLCQALVNVTIPFGVTNIANTTFANCTSLTNVTIPNSVISIGSFAFSYCTNLPGLIIPNSVTSIGDYAFQLCTALGSITIPDSVTNLGIDTFMSSGLTNVTLGTGITRLVGTFSHCRKLTSITIPSTVTNIDQIAFQDCPNLLGVFFRGNPPAAVPPTFLYSDKVIVFYLYGTTGWGATFGGRPTALWQLLPQPYMWVYDGSLKSRTNLFGFTITGSNNLPVLVEACTNLTDTSWQLVGTNTVTGNVAYFSDLDSTNYPARFYRLRLP